MPTTELHRTLPSLLDFDATITGVGQLDDGTTVIELDRSAFYARSGGQAGDHGLFVIGSGELIVTDTRYSPDRETVWHHLAPGHDPKPEVGAAVEAQVDAERRQRLTTGHTAQHLAYLASVMALGPRPWAGGIIDIDNIRVDIAHASNEGGIDPNAVLDAYRVLIDADLEIRRWADAQHAATWWWAIDAHEPIGCGGTHLDSTRGASVLEPTIKRKGSKNAVIKLVPAAP
jgi:Ser-tRNA(Ala) deacylase AlaX